MVVVVVVVVVMIGRWEVVLVIAGVGRLPCTLSTGGTPTALQHAVSHNQVQSSWKIHASLICPLLWRAVSVVRPRSVLPRVKIMRSGC